MTSSGVIGEPSPYVQSTTGFISKLTSGFFFAASTIAYLTSSTSFPADLASASISD